MLFPAQRQDCKTVEELWKDWDWNKINFVVADKIFMILKLIKQGI